MKGIEAICRIAEWADVVPRSHAVNCIDHALVSPLSKIVGGSRGQNSVGDIVAIDMEGELIPSRSCALDVCTWSSSDEDALTSLLAIRPRSGSDMYPGAINACRISAARLPQRCARDDGRRELTIRVGCAGDKLINRLSIRPRADLLIAARIRLLLARLPEIMPARIGVPQRVVSSVGILVERLRVFEMTAEVIGRHKAPHR